MNQSDVHFCSTAGAHPARRFLFGKIKDMNIFQRLRNFTFRDVQCEECGSWNVRRRELLYQIIGIVTVLFIIPMQWMLGNIEFSEPYQTLINSLGLVGLIALIALFAYDLLDPVRSYECVVCGYLMERKRKLSLWFRMFLGIMGAIFLFLIGVWLTVMLFGPEAIGW